MSRTRGFFVLFAVTCSLLGCAPATPTIAPTASPAATANGVDHNDTSFLAGFPYIGTPRAGYSAGHLHT